MLATGHRGELRVGYQVAAKLGSWSLEILPRGKASCEASVASSNQHWLESKGPFDLVLKMGSALWIWRSVTPVIDQWKIRMSIKGQPEILTAANGTANGRDR